ncbi:MAG: tetratricopeptide repeat protein [Candidatus Sumerlaeia bacterium]|nr:tetratricopeptide repeat protein [Candidatus Sumerlaeia bacterium]
MAAWTAALLSPLASAAPSWWDPQWKVRRKIEIKGARRSSYAPLVGYAMFRDFGYLKPDASDLRVANEQGKPVPFRIKFYHPRLYCVVAFQPEDTNWTGYLYYGNPAATKPDTAWEPRSGLFLTTYRRADGGSANWAQMQETVARSLSNPDGGDYRRAIFDGYNPFGSSEHFVSIYDGYFYASRTGSYRFSTVSDEASFVFIDEKLVAEWPGTHGVGGGQHGEHGGTIDLAAGPHRVQYYHLQTTGQTAAELAWTRPGEKAPRVLAPEDYLPVFEAQVGLQEFYNDPVTLEFNAAPVMTLESGGFHYILWRFGDLSGAPGKPSVSSLWDFGNGLSNNAKNPYVWFFHPGDYLVTLRTAVAADDVRTVQQWIRVSDLLQLDGSEQPNILDQVAQVVAEYPIAGLVEGDRRAILSLLVQCRRYDGIEKICRAWLDDAYRKKSTVPVEAVLELGKVLADTRRKYSEAEQVYEEAARRLPTGDKSGYPIWLALGQLRTQHLKKFDDAIAALKTAAALVEGQNDPDRRRVAIALGDAYRAKLDRTEARKFYRQAEQIGPPERMDAALRSSYGVTVESFLARDDRLDAYDKLIEWAGRFPSDKLGGYWSLLMGRCLIALQRYDEAEAELALAARLDPFGNYARDILEHLARAQAAQRRHAEAIESLRAAAKLFDDPTRKKMLDEQIRQLEQDAPKKR